MTNSGPLVTVQEAGRRRFDIGLSPDQTGS
jgi:hypothetical protein